MSDADCIDRPEEWRDVVGYEGYYQVSNIGRVRSLTRTVISRGIHGDFSYVVRGRLMTPGTGSQHGHLGVHLSRNGEKACKFVHRLVLEAFVGPCPAGMVCRHFPDRNPANNRLENLQWGTPLENEADKLVHGTMRKCKWTVAMRESRSAAYRGMKRTAESIEKQRQSVIGSRRSAEARARMSAAAKLREARKKC